MLSIAAFQRDVCMCTGVTLGALAQVVVQKSAATLYAATIDNKLAMKVGSADWSPAAGNVQASPPPLYLSCLRLNLCCEGLMRTQQVAPMCATASGLMHVGTK